MYAEGQQQANPNAKQVEGEGQGCVPYFSLPGTAFGAGEAAPVRWCKGKPLGDQRWVPEHELLRAMGRKVLVDHDNLGHTCNAPGRFAASLKGSEGQLSVGTILCA